MKKIFGILLLTTIISFDIYSCSIVKRTINGKTLVGNNEDSTNPENYLWASKSSKNNFGVVYYGTKNWDFLPQGAINDQGLVFDWLQVPTHKIEKDISKIEVNDWAKKLLTRIMSKCKTVLAVKDTLDKYDLSFLQWSQLIFIDKSGKSIIVEGDKILFSDSPERICTNFLQSEIKSKSDISCTRYLKAENLLEHSSELTIDLFKAVLDSIKQTGVWGGTQVSQVYDLEKGDIHLFLFHNFSEDITLSVKDLTRKQDTILIATLFKNKKEFTVFNDNFQVSKKLIMELDSCQTQIELENRFNILIKNPQTIIFRDELLSSAYSQLDKNNTTLAFSIIDFCFKVMNNKHRLYFEKSKMYMQIKDFRKALENIDLAISINPNVPDYQVIRTEIQLKMK